MNVRAKMKLSGMLNVRYIDDFAHLGIGSDSDEIPEWEDYLESLEIKSCSFVSEIPQKYIALQDPLFFNLFRLVSEELAEKVLVLGQFPGRTEE